MTETASLNISPAAKSFSVTPAQASTISERSQRRSWRSTSPARAVEMAAALFVPRLLGENVPWIDVTIRMEGRPCRTTLR
jgi:hypothetical protein